MTSSTTAILRGIRPSAAPAVETACATFARAVRWMPLWSIIVALLIGGACHTGAANQAPSATAAVSAQIANLRAFTRLYGVVRWFHPSDAAATIDWDRFAVEGTRRVIDAPDERALRAALANLIAPIAPTVQIAAAGEEFPNEPALHPASRESLDVVAWEHKGFGDSTLTTVYASKRRHRDRTVAVRGVPYAALWQAVDAAPFHSARLRLRGKLRAARGGRGQLWVRVERGDATGFFDNMDSHPVLSTSWEPAEIVGTVDADATRIVFGTFMSSAGTVWYDDIELAAQGADSVWKAIEIKDRGFESEDLFASWKPGIGKPRLISIDGWNATLDRSQPASGLASLRVSAATEVVTDELFADAPAPGETVNLDLGGGLRARIPLARLARAKARARARRSRST